MTFHLTSPDPDFLQKLALPFGYAVPANTPDKEVGPSNPLPATGPYMIDHYTPNQEILLVRNPHFQQWSKDAQPAGYPDQIEIRLSLTTEAEVTKIEQGQADWMYDQPPADRLNEIATNYPDQVHLNPVPQVYHMAINTRVAPFNNLKVRQAVNYATDRTALIKMWGGPHLAVPTCQMLPPDFPGTRRTARTPEKPGPAGTGRTWPRRGNWWPNRAPKATRSESRDPGRGQQAICQYFAGSSPARLYSPPRDWTPTSSTRSSRTRGTRPRSASATGTPTIRPGSDFFNIVVGCPGFHQNSDASANLSEFCDPSIQSMTAHAMQTSVTDRKAANPSGRPSTAPPTMRRPGSRCSCPGASTSSRRGSGTTCSTRR